MKQEVVIALMLFIFSITFVSAFNFETGGVKIISPLESNGAIPVNIKDQTTRPFSIRVNQILNSNIFLNQSPIINSYNLILNTGHGVIIGQKISFLEQNSMEQIYFGEVLNVATNNITMDAPVPYNFIPGIVQIFTYNNEMKVDGSTTTQIFSLKNRLSKEMDITRFIFHCTDNVAMDDSKFCGISSLNRGLVLRKKLLNGNYINYWNVKNNGNWIDLAFDRTYDAKAPAGFYGFASRLTYAGQTKHGVVIRIKPGEEIEVLVQDDLTNLEHIGVMVEGHFVKK